MSDIAPTVVLPEVFNEEAYFPLRGRNVTEVIKEMASQHSRWFYGHRRNVRADYDGPDAGEALEEVIDAIMVQMGLLTYDPSEDDANKEAAIRCAVDDIYIPAFDATTALIKRELEEAKLNSAAAAWARRCGHTVGSRDYILSAQEALAHAHKRCSDWRNNHEASMERRATSVACGQTAEGYWADEDYLANGFYAEIDSLQDVLNWLEQNVPLTMLRMREESESAKRPAN